MADIEHAAFRRLDLNLLVAFDALVGERSVTRAAARLCIGQPAMSHALSRLREVFSDELLYRAGAGMALTDKAQRLAPRVRQLLLDAQALALADTPFDPAQLVHTFQLALNDPLEALLLPNLVASLRRQAPGVALSVRPIPAWQQLEKLDEGEIQLAIGHFPKVRSSHLQHTLYRARFACVFNPALLALGNTPDLATLATLPHIHTSYTGDGPGLVDRAFQRRGLQRRVVAHTASPLSIPFIVKQSPLIAILPDLVTRLFARHHDLRISPLALPELALPVSMVIHKRDQTDPALAFFMQALLETIRNVLPTDVP